MKRRQRAAPQRKATVQREKVPTLTREQIIARNWKDAHTVVIARELRLQTFINEQRAEAITALRASLVEQQHRQRETAQAITALEHVIESRR